MEQRAPQGSAGVEPSLTARAAEDVSGRSARGVGEGAFECKTCHRRFASFQALGGHRTGHTRLQARQQLHGAEHAAAEAGAKARDDRAHGCAVCGVEFPMGQALGGHMRRHRGEAAPAAGVEQAGMLDLNYPPTTDDGGAEQAVVECPPESEPRLLNLLV